jgi:NAD(P)-dependent dehydrogenase (short-subunit alcohol dehydrogenase family)
MRNAGSQCNSLWRIPITSQIHRAANHGTSLHHRIHRWARSYGGRTTDRPGPPGRTARAKPDVFAINTLAPYILTALIERPKRLVYLSSLLHRGANANLEDLTWTERPWHGTDAYAETKLQDVLLAFAVAKRWSNVLSNALEPGRIQPPAIPRDRMHW